MKTKEMLHLLVAVIIVTFMMSFFDLDKFIYFFVAALILFSVNVAAKKISAYYLHADIETKIWHIKRYGFHGASEFQKPVAAGIFIPLIFAAVSALISFYSVSRFIIFPWLAVTEFDVAALKSRVTKRYGLYRYSEMTEFHIGLIAAAGIFACLLAAVVAYFLNFPEFAKLSIYFACFNMIPISNLDGSKIFFGSVLMWTTLAVVSVLGLGYALL